MNVKTFIDRPIFAGVISVVILLVGFIGLTQLPVEQFPEIAPPTVSVSASYAGANAETVQRSVLVPLEEAVNGVEDMMYMVSSATNSGSASIQIYFRQGTDGDMAMVNVQNRMASAQSLLPAEVTRSGVTVRKRQTSRIKQLAVYSPDNSFDRKFIVNYLKINIEPRLSRVAGVGEVDVRGGDYSLRIWLDPGKMAKYGLMPTDISAVLSEQNLEAPTGTLGTESDNTFRYVLKYRGRYEEVQDYENMVIRAESDGTVLCLKDVATIELGERSYDYIGMVNGHPGTTISISQTSGSNANEIIKNVDKVVEEIRKDLPKGLEIVDLMSTKDFLDASIKNVVKTLFEAILLVVLVVFVFLQSARSTIIPTISIVVSLVGTFAFLYGAGFSLNMITLFALVLVIGTVVDDSIVVVEAVQAKFDEGYKSAYKATVDAMGGISTALVATTFVFMAVFIPVSFMGGTTGTFYTQFGLTMAVAVGISLLNSLTLSPALCALIMTPHDEVVEGQKASFSSRFHKAFDAGFTSMVAKYKHIVLFMFKRRWLTLILLVIASAGLYYMMSTTKTGLVPKEDMGSINIDVRTPPGTNIVETDKVLAEIDKRISTIPQIKAYSRTTGFGMMFGQGSSTGNFVIRLHDWDLRKGEGEDVESIVEEIYRRTADITSADIMVYTRGMIPGYGASSGFDLYVQDQKGGKLEDLQKITNDLIVELNKRPEVSRAKTSFDTKYPMYLVEVDAAQCKRNGISPGDVLDVLAGYVGGKYASNMNRFSKLYRVMYQAAPEYRLDTESLQNMFVRNSQGEMSPINQYLRLTRIYGPQSISRFNLFTAINVNGNAAPGYSSGQAIQAVREVAEQVIPEGYGYEFSGMSREEAATGNSVAIILVICVVFIYLILCALYESIFIPIVIILSIPFGLAGSFLFARMFGLENNIYLQIGLLMLIGLLAKTAILITEFASQKRKEGMSITQSAMYAAKARLRPILMTSLTMIFGMLPLMFSRGVGANGNISIGVGTVGGMLVGTIALLIMVPPLFIIFQHIEEKVMPNRGKMERGLMLLLVLLALNSCGLYKGYDRGELPVVDSLYTAGTSDSVSAATLSWREVFADTLLQSWINTGLKYNTDLNVARLKVQEAEASLSAARGALLPGASFGASGGVYPGTFKASVDASWEADIFGSLRNAKRKAQVALEQSKAYEQAVHTQLIATIATSYYTLVMLDEQLQISYRTLRTWEENIRTLEAMKRAGKTNEAAVLQAKANKLSVEANVLTLEKNIVSTENTMCALLGVSPKVIGRTTIDKVKIPSTLSTGLPAELLERRPDVRQAELELAKAYYEINIAKAAFYPKLTLSGAIGWTTGSGSIVLDPGSIIANMLGSLTQPIFNRGRLKANKVIAQAQYEEASLKFTQSLLDAGVEVNNSLANWQSAKKRVELDKKQIVTLQATVWNTQQLMRYGNANYLEVLTAQKNLLSAELAEVSDRFEEIRSVITLYHALGGGWGE